MCDLAICRICLITNVRGYKFGQHSLRNYYEQLTRRKLNSKDALPQWVCYECAILLHKCYKFKQKCLRGEDILKQLSSRKNITIESIESVDRHKEDLISTIQYTIKNVRAKTYNIKSRESKKDFKFDKEKINKKIKLVKESENINTDHEIDDNKTVDSVVIEDNLDQIDLVKHENEVILVPVNQPDPIKAEMSESFSEIETHLSNIFGMNSDRENTNNNAEITNDMEITNDLETTNYESDIDFMGHSDHVDTSSDDDAALSVTLKKRKVRHKTRTKSEPKAKKIKTDDENEVQLKNTRPRKHFLNPQFWKKITLSEEEAVREFKQREFNNDYYLRAKYKCQNCFKGFSKNEMLVRHLKHWHDELCGQMECRFCHMRFRRKHQLVTHIQEHLIVHHCLRCNLQFSRLKTALFHQEHHNGIKRNCKHCGKEFNHLSTYYTHVRMAHRSSHVCVACGASFVSEHGLLQHTKFKHFDNLKQLEEEIRKRREASGKAEASSEQLTAAPATEAAPAQAPDTEEIYCAKCDIKFMSRRAYNLHFFKSDNHDDGDAYAAVNKDGNTGGPGSNIRAKIPTTCEHCDKDFPSRQAYKKHHQAAHAHIPLYIPDERDICEICGASIQLGSISYHMKSHTGEREFACPAPSCGMRFTLKANMKRHYNVKHLGMPYPKYIRRTPGRRKKKTQEILDNDFSPFVRTRTGYFL